MVATAIRNRQAPRVRAPEELGEDSDLETVLAQEYKEQELTLDKDMWNIVR